MTWATQQGVFNAGDITLQSGARLTNARLSWKAHGTLSPARDNVIVYPTSYGAQHPDLEWLILDSTVIRAHQHAAGAARKGAPTRRRGARGAGSGPSCTSR